MPGFSSNTKKFVAIGKALSFDKSTRRMRAVITTRDRDRQGDIVEPEGLDFTSFQNNPVLLWAHDQSKPPVGKLVEVVKFSDRVEAEIEFADTPFALEVAKLFEGGYLSAFSIGFVPKKWAKFTASKLQELGFKAEPGKREFGSHITEAEIVEVSAVPVPANAQALAKALGETDNPELLDYLQNAEIDGEEYVEAKSITIPLKSVISLPDDIPLSSVEKSFSDRSRAKFPVEVVEADGEPSITLCFKQINDNEISLAGITLAALPRADEAPDESGRHKSLEEAQKQSEDRPQRDTHLLHRLDDELVLAKSKSLQLNARVANLI